jgi:hypothetical protein
MEAVRTGNKKLAAALNGALDGRRKIGLDAPMSRS